MTADCILRATGVSVSLRGNPVLHDVDLSVDASRIYAIIGPNGCGKTTLIRALSGALKPQAGSVELLGSDIARQPQRAVARHLAVLWQGAQTQADVSVRDLAAYGRFAHRRWWGADQEEDAKVIDWALRTTALEDRAHRRLGELSGGERQRAWLAMCLAQRPEILLLDEPTTYLDVAHQLEVMELVARLNRDEGLTIVMVLHDLNHAARYSDELVVMREGSIVASGPPNVLDETLLRSVFDIDSLVVAEPQTGNSIIYPIRRVGSDTSPAGRGRRP